MVGTGAGVVVTGGSVVVVVVVDAVVVVLGVVVLLVVLLVVLVVVLVLLGAGVVEVERVVSIAGFSNSASFRLMDDCERAGRNHRI